MSEINNRFLKAALAYARLGWPVFPLSPGTKIPLKGTRGFEDATTDLMQIRRWWARWPAANIGLPPGAAGMVAIDLDVKGDVDGGKNWHELKIQHGIDDDTLTSRTPSFESAPQPAPGTTQDSSGGLPPRVVVGGQHLFFKLPAGANLCISNRRLGPGIDVRGHKGYVVLPPSGDPRRRPPGRVSLAARGRPAGPAPGSGASTAAQAAGGQRAGRR